jgi:hypothetical protein
MVELFTKLFSRMAGNGRAWKIKDAYTRGTIQAMLSISNQVRDMFARIPKEAYPWSCSDEAVPRWEKHFGVSPPPGATIENRRSSVVSEYTAIGSNAKQYLEYILAGDDHNPIIIENPDGLDLGGTWDAVQFRIANGVVATYETDTSPAVYKDPVDKPTTARQWTNVYIVIDTMDNVSGALMRDLILKYSSSHTVALLINNDPESLYFDAGLVNKLVPGNWVIDAELVENVTTTLQSTAYTGNSLTNTQEGVSTRSAKLSDNGIVLQLTGEGSPSKVVQYLLSVAWDISSATYAGSMPDSFPVGTTYAALDTTPDGLHMYVALTYSTSRNIVQKYTMTSPWDVTTATLTGTSIEILAPFLASGIAIHPSQSSVYVTDKGGQGIFQLPMTVPGDLSTITFFIPPLPVPGYSVSGDMSFNSTGTVLLAAIYDVPGGAELTEWTLATPWDITTATLDNSIFNNPDNLIQPGFAHAATIIRAGKGMLVSTNGVLYQYTTPGEFNPLTYTSNAEIVMDGELVI